MKVKAAHQTGPPIQAKGQEGHPHQINLPLHLAPARHQANAKPDQGVPKILAKKNAFHHQEANHLIKAEVKAPRNQPAALAQAIEADLKDAKHLIQVALRIAVQVEVRKEVLEKRKKYHWQLP